MKENLKLNLRERKKQERGITLVALVVTIVVLLILAGITIITLTGENGIIATAQNAKKQNTKAELKEQIERAVINSRLSILSDANMDLSKLEVDLLKINGLNIESKGENGSLPWVVTVNGYKFQINENGTVEVVEGIILSKTTLKLIAGESETITASLTEGVTGTVTWESSDESIVTVNNGVVTAVGNSGTATIKAKVEGASFEPASCTVTIVQKVTSIAVNSATLEIEQGGTVKIVATPNPSTNVEDLVFSSNNNKITVEEKGTVAEDGRVTAKITVASDATVGSTATITVKGEKTGEVAGKTATCTITVKKAALPIGQYVEYNVSYTDMYVADIDTEEGNQGFTAQNGWRILDVGEPNADGSYSNAKIVSTGIPALLYYHYTTGTNGSPISSENVPSWWGTTEQVGKLYGTTIANRGYIYLSDSTTSGYPNYYAATGLELNEKFETIPFENKTSSLTYNKGGYSAINKAGQQATSTITGDIFKIADKASGVHNLTLKELNTAINKINGNSNRGETSTSGVASYDLFYLKGLSKFNYSSAYPYYWLAFPNSGNTDNLRYVYHDSSISYGGGCILGVRPVVSLKSDIYKEGDIWKIK